MTMTTLRRSLLASAALAVSLPVAAPSFAQTDGEQIALAEEIIVTGTRRIDRTVADSNVPIDVVSFADLTASGFTETNQLIAGQLPSFNFPQPSITDGTDHIRPATLRGLAPDHTLVLVNGKRRHTSALLNINGSVGRGSTGVDMNMIPTSAIERVEVLRDGAAAQYGSDAIAGVINIVLKGSDEGGSLTTTYGQYVTAIEDVTGISAVNIVDNGDGTQSLEIIEDGSDRKARDGETLTISGDAGLPIGNAGFFHVSAEYRDRNPTNRSGYDIRQQYASLPDGSLDPRELTFNRFNHRFGNSAVEDVSIFFNMAVNVTPEVEFYSFGSYGTRDGESGGFYRRSLDSRNVVEIYPDGFLPLITSDVNDLSVAGGLRGDIFDWSYDLSVVYGENKLTYGVINSLNRSLGPTSQTEFDAGGLKNEQMTVNLDLKSEFDISGLDAPLFVAFGAEYRDETYEVFAGEVASYIDGPFDGAAGSQVFPGFQPSNEIVGTRDSVALYVELDTDLTEAWNITVAGRFEDFSDFGSTAIGKLATRFEVNDAIALRGAVSTGFRAPSLAQQFFTATSTNFIDGIPNEVGTFPATSDVAASLGGQQLQAEDSLNLSAGFVLTPIDGLNLTADFYRITIDDRVVLSENLTVSDIPGITRARFFTNAVDTRTQGVDIVANYTWDLEAAGQLKLTGGFNYNDTNITNDPDEAVFRRREQARFEIGTPKSKVITSASWYWNDLTVTPRATRYGETTDPGTTVANDEVLPSRWIIDLDINYDFSETVSLGIGANNVFDNYPQRTPPTSTFNRIFPFSGFSPFGFAGRFVYARATVRY